MRVENLVGSEVIVQVVVRKWWWSESYKRLFPWPSFSGVIKRFRRDGAKPSPRLARLWSASKFGQKTKTDHDCGEKSKDDREHIK